MSLADWASVAGILAVPLAVVSILVALAQGSRQRRVREQLRVIITQIRTELGRAANEIKTGGDLHEVPEIVEKSHEKIKPLYNEIRFVQPREVDELSLAIIHAKAAWDLVLSRIRWSNRNEDSGKSPDANDVRKRARTEDFLVDMIDRADSEIARMLKKLRRLDSGNIIAALLTR